MMQLRGEDAVHRSAMYKILTEIADDPILSRALIFKGGTCAVLLGWLERFSVDLDFDLAKDGSRTNIRHTLESVFSDLSFPITHKHPTVIMYRVKYSDIPTVRKTVKVSVHDGESFIGEVKPLYLSDIDRTLVCQSQETMVAHKMIALIGRYNDKKEIAGRDVYDIYEFFLHRYPYDSGVIKARTGFTSKQYLQKMIQFIEEKVTQQVIDEDLNLLLPPKPFQIIRKTLKTETLMLLREELKKYA